MFSDSGLVYFKDGLVFTSTLKISEYFGIHHGEIFEDIKFLLSRDSSLRVHFISYRNSLGFNYYELSRIGFVYWLCHFGSNLDCFLVRDYLLSFSDLLLGYSSCCVSSGYVSCDYKFEDISFNSIYIGDFGDLSELSIPDSLVGVGVFDYFTGLDYEDLVIWRGILDVIIRDIGGRRLIFGLLYNN